MSCLETEWVVWNNNRYENFVYLAEDLNHYTDTLAEFKSYENLIRKMLRNRFQFIVITRVYIFGKCLLSCLFIITEYLDARFITNYKKKKKSDVTYSLWHYFL